MSMFLLLGDNDPHLPKLMLHAFANFSPAYLSTVKENDKKYVKLKGKDDRTWTKESLLSNLESHLGKRVCLYSDFEKYFLKESIFSSVRLIDEEWIMLFEVDSHTYRDDEHFKENPLDVAKVNLDEISEDLQERYSDFLEVIERLEHIFEKGSELETNIELNWNEIQYLRSLIYEKLDNISSKPDVEILNSAMEKLGGLAVKTRREMEEV